MVEIGTMLEYARFGVPSLYIDFKTFSKWGKNENIYVFSWTQIVLNLIYVHTHTYIYIIQIYAYVGVCILLYSLYTYQWWFLLQCLLKD